jgi:alkylated DNA nucleotide flippase Atl1
MSERAAWIEEAYELVRSIPPGKVMSYGAVGSLLKRPVSGLLIGRLMFTAPEGVPWWRVVAKDGSFPIGKRDPRLAREQASKLAREGAPFERDGRVAMAAALWHG